MALTLISFDVDAGAVACDVGMKRTSSSATDSNLARRSAALAGALSAEMTWLAAAIEARIRSYFGENIDAAPLPPPPKLAASPYTQLLTEFAAGAQERLLLALALAPHAAPQVLDVFFLKNEKTGRGFTEFGGVEGGQHAGFLPTGQTALFLLCGGDMPARLAALALLDPSHPLHLHGPLRLAAPQAGEPAWSGVLSFSAAHFRQLVQGGELPKESVARSLASPVTTALTWDDLVLDEHALLEIGEIKTWANHRRELLEGWGLGRHVHPGYRALFHGPAGTGKRLAATLLGQELGVDVYRIDLSQVVLRQPGETEKDLAAVFAEATRRSWILFFDEADALFGKRTAIASSHDRYANQAAASFLQRIEEHDGIVILATNLKANFDEAFARRFQTTVHFPPPNEAQRLRLWRNGFGSKSRMAADVDLAQIARDFELTGAQIINVVRFACMQAVQAGGTVTAAAIKDGCRRELRRIGRRERLGA